MLSFQHTAPRQETVWKTLTWLRPKMARLFTQNEPIGQNGLQLLSGQLEPSHVLRIEGRLDMESTRHHCHFYQWLNSYTESRCVHDNHLQDCQRPPPLRIAASPTALGTMNSSWSEALPSKPTWWAKALSSPTSRSTGSSRSYLKI